MNIKQKILIFNSSIAGVLLIIGIFIIIPTINNILNLRSSINQINQDVEDRYGKSQKLKKSITQLKQIKETVFPYDKSTVDQGGQLELITQLEKIANDNQIEQTLNVELVTPAKANPKNNQAGSDENLPAPTQPNTPPTAFPTYFHFTFLNNGSFQNHLKYLKSLEGQHYYMVINNLQWSKKIDNTTPASTPITLRFEGIIYVNP